MKAFGFVTPNSPASRRRYLIRPPRARFPAPLDKRGAPHLSRTNSFSSFGAERRANGV